MIAKDEKTPAVVRLDLPSLAPPERGTSRPPPGRPPASVTIAEMRARITADVRQVALGELDRRTSELQDRLTSQVRTASTVALAALALTIAALALLVISRLVRESRLGFAIVAAAALAIGAAITGSRRGRPTPRP